MTIKNHRLAGAPYIASPNKSGKINPRFIVMHYTAGYTAESAINILTRKGSGVSAHVTVGLDGTITQHVPFNVKAWHAGPSRHMGYNGLNNYSIGIEIVNIGWLRKIGSNQYQDSYGNIRSGSYFPNFPNGMLAQAKPRVGGGTYYWPLYSEEQLVAVEDLTVDLLNKYDILDIVSHEEIDTRGWKTDPGPAFPMKRYTQHLTSDRGNDSELFKVTASSLNIRGGPGTKFGKIGSYQQGDEIELLEQYKNWGKVSSDGWVYMSFLQRI